MDLFFLLIVSITTNLALHYYNKRNIFLYKDSIPQLLVLYRCVKDMATMDLPTKPDERLLSSIKSIGGLRSKISVFVMENKNDSDIYAVLFLVIEYLKIIFLLEPLIVFKALEQLNNKREDVKRLFDYIGKIDLFVSIASMRKEVPYYCPL